MAATVINALGILLIGLILIIPFILIGIIDGWIRALTLLGTIIAITGLVFIAIWMISYGR